MNLNDVFDLLSGDIGLKIAAHLRGLGFWTQPFINVARSCWFFWSWLCFGGGRRHSGRGHSREGWAWWATHTTVSTADELAGSGWKWMEVNLEGGRDVLPSPKRTGTLEPFTWSISWSVQTCLFGCTHSVRSLPVCRFEDEIRHWQNVYSNQLDLFMSVHGLYLVAVQWNQKQSRHFL